MFRIDGACAASPQRHGEVAAVLRLSQTQLWSMP
jgi:hypothetical protein